MYVLYIIGRRRGAGAQESDCNAMVMGSILTWGNRLLFTNIFISSLWHQGKSPALSSTTQHAMPLKIQRKVGNGVF